MSKADTHRYLAVSPGLLQAGRLLAPELSGYTERHRCELLADEPHPVDDLLGELSTGYDGAVLLMDRGVASRAQLRLARRIRRLGLKVFLYWPREGAVEVLDRYGYWRHWRLAMFVGPCNAWLERTSALDRLRRRISTPARNVKIALSQPGRTARVFVGTAKAMFFGNDPGDVRIERFEQFPDGQPTMEARSAQVRRLIERARPVELAVPDELNGQSRLRGPGVYLRTDYWAKIASGGSYGHTCYVAKELAALTDGFICFMAHRYSLLDELGLRQVVMEPPFETWDEDAIVKGASNYWRSLRPAFEALRPAYIYERICLANWVGARLSQELEIPYIVEYNGSEISMQRSFGAGGFKHEDYYLLVEEAAFRQATAIVVVSQIVKDELVGRGVDADKILVNPNGADVDAYSPVDPTSRAKLREDLGMGAEDWVIGFTGTFGGWHGIDVLAAGLPRILAEIPDARFLLIGDGAHKHLVEAAVKAHGLEDRVLSVGRVEQQEGARLLPACDVFVSPHSSNMVDSPFFGSPTKLFEYMAVGGGIVASDLEQIGTVLSPALRPSDLATESCVAGSERAVLCTPGNVDEFVQAVVGISRHRDVCRTLGHNARQAVLDHYSWRRNVGRIFSFLRGDVMPGDGLESAIDSAPSGGIRPAATGDSYKDEVQDQWDNDACGSHYVKEAERHTLGWYLEAEQYRYDDYAPWMRELMEFDVHRGKRVLELGAGMGTDLAQFAAAGAKVVDLDLSRGHLTHARENFALRNLPAGFLQGDGENLPFADSSFDLVYSNGVIHHTPNSRDVIRELHRILKPGGTAVVMLYCETSLHYWKGFAYKPGVRDGLLREISIGEIMSRMAELTTTGARPLVKAYSKAGARALFEDFGSARVFKRQLTRPEMPPVLRFLPLPVAGKLMGWNLIVKAVKA